MVVGRVVVLRAFKEAWPRVEATHTPASRHVARPLSLSRSFALACSALRAAETNQQNSRMVRVVVLVARVQGLRLMIILSQLFCVCVV